MRWFALLSVLFLAGCAQPPDGALPQGGDPTIATGIAPAAASVPVHFAGKPETASIAFDRSFPPDQWCQVDCDTRDHLYDLTDKVPAGVPVHLRAVVTGGAGEYDAFLSTTGTTFSTYRTTEGAGTIEIEVDFVRSRAESSVGLVLLYYYPEGPEAAPTLHAEVTLQTDPTRVPPGQPVALTLKPGDTVNATGEGVKGLHLLPPKGAVLQDSEAPVSLRIPADGAAGTYIAIVSGTAAAHLEAPNQTLQARRYTYHLGTPHEVAAGQTDSWDEAIPDLPVRVGLRLECKRLADLGCSGSFRSTGTYAIAAPDGAEVFGYGSSCHPVCDLTVAGYFQRNYYGPFLDPHLTPGTFRATASVPQGNAMLATVVWSTIE